MRITALVRGFASTFLRPRPPRTERAEPLTRTQILALLDELPVSEWRYDWDPDTLHIGPMAQDWRAAFGYGCRETTIDVVDAQGVLIAAVQELSRRVRQLEEQRPAPAPCRCTHTTEPEPEPGKDGSMTLAETIAALLHALGPVIGPF
ncbi:tail fiber domain-containing protein [Streptomyces sp. NPDC059076]|uniref:tail fiber domain-containing protein n=1 Tax=unclassified Streptomyces TaxID=2593676 RepID=UPI0036BA6773